VELVLHPDWRPDIEPRTKQPDPWQASAKWNADDLALELERRLARVGGRVLSVHANRDLGIFLGADESEDRRVGEALLRENCELARRLGARLIVIHAWDTWATSYDPAPTSRHINAVANAYPEITLTVENIPVSAHEWSQAELFGRFARLLDTSVGFTLDLSWSSLYDNLEELIYLLPRVRNVHVQGRISRTGRGSGMTADIPGELRLEPRAGELDIDWAIQKLLDAGYTGQWTLELNRARSLDDFRLALAYLRDRVAVCL